MMDKAKNMPGDFLGTSPTGLITRLLKGGEGQGPEILPMLMERIQLHVLPKSISFCNFTDTVATASHLTSFVGTELDSPLKPTLKPSKKQVIEDRPNQ